MSARALRDAQDADELEEPWIVTAGKPETKRASGTGFSPASGMLLLVIIIVVVLVAPPGKVGGGGQSSTRSFSTGLNLPERIRTMLEGSPSFDFTESFESGIEDWLGQSGRSGSRGGWNWDNGRVQLGKLRVWKPTLTMSNYQMLFQGQIERKAMGWAFRATDLDNYYATKIAIRGGGSARTEIERFVVVGGEKSDRVTLPLPVSLDRSTPYRVGVQVKGDRFSTMINGQVVDSWRDPRHAKGGVGFFSEPGEQAMVTWVRITDGNRLFDRLPSFSLMVTPQDLLLVP
ncbi:MAG: hypothetical protein GY953_25575 [bacterium]|nr:hypothetical protein [bacterium]